MMPTAAEAGQQGKQQDSSLPCFPLLSAPDSWIHSFLSTTDYGTRLALLQTCTALKRRLLNTQRDLLRVGLDAPSVPANELTRQQVILRQAADIKLRAVRVYNSDADKGLSCLLMRHMALLGGPLRNITIVRLEYCILPEVVPSCLVVACPNMKRLELDDCVVGEDLVGEQVPPLPVCPQLTELVLHSLRGDRAHGFERAACLLPNLTLLDLDAKFDNDTAWKALAPLSAQLQQLGVHRNFDSVGLRLLQKFLRLTHANFESITLNDSLMEALLTLPNLKHVNVFAIDLDTCFQQSACCWEHLRMRSGGCTIASLAHLPLHGIQKLDLSGVLLRSRDTQAIVADAINNMARCGCVQAVDGLLWVDDYGGNLDLLCKAALPLLQHIRGCEHLRFAFVKGISTGFVDQLAQSLCHACKAIEFYACSLNEHSLDALAVGLPGSVNLITRWSVRGRVHERIIR